jgi:dihydrofolate synthase/folylpolyglutamate synthase
LASIYREQGLKIGKYTSPHLVSLNERFEIDGQYCSDLALCDAFDQIESLRNGIELTEFEYLTLAAMWLFQQQAVEIAILEVGLGGRLDAVNAFDADVSVITSIGLDHQEWLGDTEDQIGFEKAGIMRSNRPCVFAGSSLPNSIKQHAEDINANLICIGQDFQLSPIDHGGQQSNNLAPAWHYKSEAADYADLPLPFGKSGVYLANAAAAITVVRQLYDRYPVSEKSIRQGIKLAALHGRCQVVYESPLIILDVAHNPAAVQQLSNYLNAHRVNGKVYALCGFLKDKAIADCLNLLERQIDNWAFVPTTGVRGLESSGLYDVAVKSGIKSADFHDSTLGAFTYLKDALNKDDCLLVFGSFQVVGDIIAVLKNK